ncbi:hypothetical protein M408DRAFT_28665 [Serendipita vermifera MAFF 305830]|uniref:Fungal-type protein kinase domain-containing protein n=1 Tax=Serendipita vermifera MAFF 305830 TaxID=933852 RepID=A0A0C2W7X9_SERVB|nr:hypothetical protein M408DRAFT_28665 [Serendipita vermifera MAFF 305830]
MPTPMRSSYQSQISTSSHHEVQTCKADVIPANQLLEAVYGKLNDVANIRTKLEGDGFLFDKGWRALLLNKNVAFKGLSTIFEQCVRGAGIRVNECIVQCSVHGLESKFPNNTRPDATIHLTKSSFKWTCVQIDHGDVCLYVQFKTKNTTGNFEDNTSKLLWNVHHRFRSDPCCRFVCGLTIEDNTAQFWHFSRATVMVSKPFDILKDANKLIHIFVGSARAKSSAELGFDPTITCITKDPKALERYYAIQVSDNKNKEENLLDKKSLPRVHTFITHHTISNYRAVGIRSRGTWVWEAIEENQQDTIVVIKDVWIDADREVEGAILEHPLCHGCVLNDGDRDLTQPLLPSTGTTSFIYSNVAAPSRDPTTGSKHTSEKSVGSPPNVPTQKPAVISRRGSCRKHYRIVFKGKAGRALHEVDSPRDYFTGLLGGIKALHALHRAGYIHRDLSTGNVLLVKGDQGKADHGVLIDLEYAKKFPDISEASHDIRKGTPQFMAVEVNLRVFLFLPDVDLPPAVPWFHNPIHDTESAWWIALWAYRHADDMMGTLFRGQGTRTGALTTPGMFRRNNSALPDHARHSLNDWLQSIQNQYKELGGLLLKQPHPFFDYNSVFNNAIKFIEGIVTALLKEPGYAFPGERLASVAEGSPPTHQKFEDDQSSS